MFAPRLLSDLNVDDCQGLSKNQLLAPKMMLLEGLVRLNSPLGDFQLKTHAIETGSLDRNYSRKCQAGSN